MKGCCGGKLFWLVERGGGCIFDDDDDDKGGKGIWGQGQGVYIHFGSGGKDNALFSMRR